jgi:exonuclease III
MKIIYWNTHSTQSIEIILEIVRQEYPDFFFLSEIDDHILEESSETLNSVGFEFFPNPGCNRVSIIRKKEIETNLDLQNEYFTTIRLPQYDLYIISLHLPSQMFQHMDGLKEFIRDFRLEIDSEIGCSTEKNILVIGDFNVNPYEKPMIDFDGFLATNYCHSRKLITHLGKSRSVYYNPTWQLYSKKNFPGTKYFPRPSASSYDIIECHFLDQVVISQHLLNKIISETIQVIENTENFTLFSSERKSISGSDHLPLSYQFVLSN